MNDKQNPHGIPTEEEARNKKRVDAQLRILIKTMEPFGFNPVDVFGEFGAPARAQLRQDIGKHHFTGTAALIMTKLLNSLDSVEATLTALHAAAIKQSARVAELECINAIAKPGRSDFQEEPGLWEEFDRLECIKSDASKPIASVPTEVSESGWQWHPTQADTAFAPPFGTIRVCIQCGCLVAGGPTRCVRCGASDNEQRLAALEAKVAELPGGVHVVLQDLVNALATLQSKVVTLEAEVATKIAFPVLKRPDPTTPKVLKSGFKPYKVNCNCGCEYRVESPAAHVFERRSHSSCPTDNYVSTCPECSRKNWVPITFGDTAR